MSKHVIFYFSGTGNCLKVARDISEGIGNCDVISMNNIENGSLTEKYGSIGFVYPVYFQGIPIQVDRFVAALGLQDNGDAYYYAVSTYGGNAGNGVSLMAERLSQKGVTLHYGEKLVMMSNYIVLYGPSEQVKEKTESANEHLVPIVENIKKKYIHKIKPYNKLLNTYYNMIVKKVPRMDRNFNVSETCISCGVCAAICPVQNIELVSGKPEFRHHCEQCMACIQFCPKESINYKNKTQKRKRYTNPSISTKELIAANQKRN